MIDPGSLRKFSHVVSATLSFHPGLLSSRGAWGERRFDLAEDARPRNTLSDRRVNAREAARALCRFDESFSSRQLDSACTFRGLRAIWEIQSLSLARSRQRGPVRSGQALSRDEILGCAVLSTVPRPALSRRSLVPASRFLFEDKRLGADISQGNHFSQSKS